ncbi:MAG: SMP-30/gluconolactonase/LRE family protein, partial [Pseudomonadota bacterium]
MSVEVRDERFRNVIGDSIAMETLASDFLFTEGPIWHPGGKHLTFSDMPGDHMRRWYPDGRIETFRKPCNKANGNAYDRDGLIVTCEHSTSRVTRTLADGSIEILATHYDGKELNSPNDIIVHSSGRIFFTDPTYGRMEYYGVPRETELDYQGAYSMNGDGSDLQTIATDFEQPNGLCFSIDETKLYVNDTVKKHIRRFDVDNAGNVVGGGEIWASPTGEGAGHPDGMKSDIQDNVYCTGPG